MDDKKRVKPRALKPSIKRYLFTEAIRQRKVPRELLANRLIRDIEESYEIPPTLETAKRYISKARNTFNAIDKPWTLGACRDYPTFFPAGSLPFLMQMHQDHRNVVDILTKTRWAEGFSIRKAIWIVRLRPLIQEIFGPDGSEEESRILFNIAGFYSVAERTSETMGEETFDTTDLDEALHSGDWHNILWSTFAAVERQAFADFERQAPSGNATPTPASEMTEQGPTHTSEQLVDHYEEGE